jgi:hypothetical protein
MIPKVGDKVRVGVTLQSTAEAPLPVPLTVELRDSSPDQPDHLVGRQTVRQPFGVGESRDVAFDWQPTANDWHQLTFTVTLSPGHPVTPSALPVRIPVVHRDLYFAWFGSPTNFKWCNVPTTVKDEAEARLWLRRGAWPCHWKGGVCYKEWPTERFADSYSAHKWIAIDEVGGPGEVTDKIVAAIREHKRRHPQGFVAVWYMGAHGYWRDVADAVDLFLPEIYLNYRGNHLGHFEPYLRTTRETGTIAKCLPGLGINVVKDEKTGEVRASPTREDVLRQIQHLKRIAPDWPGVGFFTSGSAAPGVAEYADQLCEDYYLNPVLRFVEPHLKVSGQRFAPGAEVTVRGEVANVGGTPARNVAYEARLLSGDGTARTVHRGALDCVLPGEREMIEFPVALPDGIRVLEVALKPQATTTLLDGTASRVLAGLKALTGAKARVLSLVPVGFPRKDLLVTVPDLSGRWRLTEVDESGHPAGEVPQCELEIAPGSQEHALTFVARGMIAPGQRRFFLLSERESQPYPWPDPPPPVPETLRVTRDSYTAALDTTGDALVSLCAGAERTELLRSPWRFSGMELGKPKSAHVVEWPALATFVTLVHESDEVSTTTRYAFFHQSPVIEIARRLVPKKPLTLKGASEGCTLEQRGGVFALQPGVGGPVNRGQLQDSDKYRDLLFGYLGEDPRPDNADKAGWFDFSWPPALDAGLGVVVARRWRDAATASYDVTRYYDAADWLQVNYVWGTETTIERPQESMVCILPHGYVDLTDENVVSPAQAFWETMHAGVEVANGGGLAKTGRTAGPHPDDLRDPR